MDLVTLDCEGEVFVAGKGFWVGLPGVFVVATGIGDGAGIGAGADTAVFGVPN